MASLGGGEEGGWGVGSGLPVPVLRCKSRVSVRFWAVGPGSGVGSGL